MDTLTTIDTALLIGSAFEAGQEAREQILNPRTGGLILEVPEASTAQVDRAVAAARKAFEGWSRTTPAERSAALLRIADRIEAEADEFARLEALNCGKPINAALNDELPAIVDCYRFFAGAVRCQTGALAGEYMAGHTSMIRRDPVGVIASIAPWNYPLMMMAWKLGPSIGGGNTVVFKPSEQTPLTALKMAHILADELPQGVVSVITGRGHTVGSYLINHPGVDMISLTGDVATGKKMLDAAAKTVKRTHLELGGKAPVLVFDDADVAEVVDGLRAFGYYNAGQDCTAACRIYAGKKVYDRLVADLSSAVSSITLGAEDDTTNEIGPLICLAPARPRGQLRQPRPGVAAYRGDGGGRGDDGGVLLPPHRRCRCAAGGRDRAPRSVWPGRVDHPVHRCGSGGGLGQRQRLWSRVLGLDPRCGPRDGDGGAAALRLHLDQHAFHAGQRDAAWRVEAVGLRQGHERLCAGGLYRRAACDGQTRLGILPGQARRATINKPLDGRP